MKKLRQESETESHSIIPGPAIAPTIHAVRSVTVVLTVAVDDAQLARTVVIRWHRTREGMQKSGTPSPDGVEGVTTTLPPGHTITYKFVADRPGTFTYHARYSRDRATSLVDVQGNEGVKRYRRGRATGLVNVRACEAGPSVGGPARADPGRRARTAAGQGVFNVPRSDLKRPTADGRVGATVRRAIGCARASRGMASVEAQLMYDCPVIYYDATEYDEGPPVQRLLRWSVATVAAAAVNVRGCVAGPSADRSASTAVRRAAGGSRGRVSVEAERIGNNSPVISYDGGPPVQRFLRWSVATLAAGVLWVSGICGPRDPDVQVSTTLS